MKVLLDTHAFIWWDSAPEKLSPQARAACQDRTNLLLLSVASAWEIQIKLQLGKLHLRLPLAEVIASQQQINDLQSQLQRYQAAGEAGISPELLSASEELRQATTADEMRTASERIARLTAKQNGSGRNPAPPRQPSQPPSRDEQITAALRERCLTTVPRRATGSSRFSADTS